MTIRPYLILLRLIWCLTFGRRPVHTTEEPRLLRLAARVAHLALYALLLTAPVLGWLYLDAKAVDIHPYGVAALELPTVLYYDRPLAMAIYEVKKVVVYGLLALILLHAAAALIYHTLIRRMRCCALSCHADGAGRWSLPWVRCR